MGLHDIRRDRKRFSRLNYRLRTLLLGLSVLLIFVSVLLAVIIFSYVFDIATHPLNARTLIDQWASMFMEQTSQASSKSSPFDGPARWFAVVTLIVLAYLLIRIPLLMLQMGTQLLVSCQEDNRELRSFVRQILQEINHPDKSDDDLPESR
jgi:L-asparagine transporter-like permease